MIQGYPHDLGNIHMCRPTCFHPSPNPLRQVEHADHGGRMPLAMCELQKRGDLLHLRLDYNNYYYYYKNKLVIAMIMDYNNHYCNNNYNSNNHNNLENKKHLGLLGFRVRIETEPGRVGFNR